MSWWQAYTAVPFADGGRSLAGCDCWGLAVLIHARHLGVTLPDRPGVAARDGQAIHGLAAAGLAEPCWMAVTPGLEQPFDLAVLWRPYRDAMGVTRTGPIHCGIVTRPSFLVHADEDTGVTEVSYQPMHWSLHARRIEFHRWQGNLACEGCARTSEEAA